MIDIHSHILPGVDDGPKDNETALKIARLAAEDGIKTMIATPHIRHDTGPPSASSVREKVSAFNQLLNREKINLSIIAGAEVAFHTDLNSLTDYCLHNGPYLLVEFPHTHLPGKAASWLYDLQLQGLSPIIAHPERNNAVIRDPNLLLRLLVPGISVQLTAESVTGEFGPDVQHCAHYLLRRKAAQFLATDAHSLEFRRPCLSKARKIAGKIIGKTAAARLVNDHPAAVVRGEKIPDIGG